MDIKTAIEAMENIKEYWSYKPTEAKAADLAIKALERQAFFENEVSHIHGWFVDNKDCLLDSAMSISRNWFDDCNVDGKMDKVDMDFMIEDIVDEIQKGILNVLSTYKDDEQ